MEIRYENNSSAVDAFQFWRKFKCCAIQTNNKFQDLSRDNRKTPGRFKSTFPRRQISFIETIVAYWFVFLGCDNGKLFYFLLKTSVYPFVSRRHSIALAEINDYFGVP